MRLLRIPLICFMMLALLCSAAIFVGRSQPQLTILPELKPCGDSLCYLGIVPGETTLDKAMAILDQVPELKPDDFNYSAERIDHSYAIYLFALRNETSPNPETIFEVDLLIHHNWSLPLGSIISTLGPPCNVLSYGHGINLNYPNAIVQSSTLTDSLTPASAIAAIVLRTPQGTKCRKADPTGTVFLYDWQGFRDYSALK